MRCKSETQQDLRYLGIPVPLLPQAGSKPTDASRFEVVDSGPRDMAARPFDYRNPFPLLALEAVSALQPNPDARLPFEWPVRDDSAEPFNYYCNDHAAIGVPGGPHCALIDGYGTLRAFTGAWGFAFGQDAAAPALRHRFLREGWIPVVEAACSAEGMQAAFTWFSTRIRAASDVVYPLAQNGSFEWVGGPAPKGPNVFHRVECRLSSPEDRPHAVAVRLGYSQAAGLCSGAFYAKPRYTPDWDSLCWRPLGQGNFALCATAGGETMCLGVIAAPGWDVQFPDDAAPIDHWPPPPALAPERHARETAVLSQALAAGGSGRIALWVPEFPAPMADAAALATADAAALEHEVIAMWRDRHRSRMTLTMPEEKVAQAYRQALNHLDLMSVAIEQTEYPTPGPNGGHHIFYDRDAPDMIHAYDIAGEPGRAARMIDHYWLRGAGQEASSMILWLLDRHFQLTQDRVWAERMFPMVVRCMTNLVRMWADHQADNDGLLPATSVPDNELAQGHYVSYHLYAVAGVRGGIRIAQALNQAGLVEGWTTFADGFEQHVHRHLEKLGQKTCGVLTPTFEGHDAAPVTVDISWENPPRKVTFSGAFGETGGCDWHNLAAVFPTGVLPPHHPLVTSSLERWRHMVVEGAFPYPQESDYARVHNYNGMNLSGAWLRRGDWAETVRDLYGVLLHTSSTHASAEVVNTAIRYDYGCTPHNWFSGKLVRFIRDLLVYEDDDGFLHVLAGLSPAWMMPGMTVGVENAPTTLGTVSFAAIMRDDGMDIDLDWVARPEAKALVLHLPPFLQRPSVTADGRHIRKGVEGWRLKKNARHARVSWHPAPMPDLSFERVVTSYLADYLRRLETLETSGERTGKNASRNAARKT